MLRAVLLIVVLIGSTATALAQASPDPDLPRSYPSVQHDEPARRPLALKNVWVSEYQPNSNEKKLLQPSVEDEHRFAGFLRLPDTGIIRLFPVGPRRVISIAELEKGRRPGFGRFACMYSFSKMKHGTGLHGWVDPRLGWAELRLQDGRFFSGFTGESLGVLVALGDVPLETVSDESDGVTGLTNITPPTDYLEATGLSRRNRSGFALERYSYGSSLPAVVNMTYAVRSTSNNRADLLVGFRVVRIGESGDMTILWRKLKVFAKPSWKRR